MIILGIETSCDETACAILTNNDKRITILSNVVSSSAKLQEKYGGVIPEQAAREQLRSIIPIIQEALTIAFTSTSDSKISNFKFLISKIDAVAVTYGPGLIGSLLVGVETAKTLALIWEKPLIPVNHLIGHFYANWISDTPKFPAIGLLISGGHTDLLLFNDHGKYEYLGGTRDDAAGECFDKCARLLGLPYPGGPNLARLASQGQALRFDLPRPMINSRNFDFSFSGLKTAVANLVHTWEVGLDSSQVKADLAAAVEQAIIDVLVTKTIQAVQKYQVKNLIIAGGVAANQELIRKFKVQSVKCKVKLHFPPPELCTDNAAMVATAAFFNYQPINPLNLQANPALYLKWFL